MNDIISNMNYNNLSLSSAIMNPINLNTAQILSILSISY